MLSRSHEAIQQEKDISIQVQGLAKEYILNRSLKAAIFQLFNLKNPSSQEKFTALKNISFDLKKGQTIGIIGRNGSGKSTLLQLICGVLSPTKGRVIITGRIAAMLELGAGFNPNFTGRENVIFSAALIGLSKKEILGKFEEIERFAEIGSFIDQPVKVYSSGMYARLAFAVSISIEPDILIIDEALAVGDEVFQRKCFGKIEEIKKSGTTILFVSHSSSSIVNLCDQAILLHKGEILYNGDPQQAVYYLQKISNALDGELNKLVYEIKTETQSEASPLLPNEDTSKNDRLNSITLVPQEEPEIISTIDSLDDKEFFDSNLKTTSHASEPSQGIQINSAQLLTLEGTPVNTIITGRAYRFKVFLEALQDCTEICAVSLIRTKDGIELGGCQSPNLLENNKISVKKADKMEVDFDFKCMLNEGTYFCSFALQALNGSMFHYIKDMIAFRVIHPTPGHATGSVDLSYKAIVSTKV